MKFEWPLFLTLVAIFSFLIVAVIRNDDAEQLKEQIVALQQKLADATAPQPSPEVECFEGSVAVPYTPTEEMVSFGMVIIGEAQLCGMGLKWSGVYGPSIEAWKEGSDGSK